jgi:hypothetical protein
MLEVMVTSLPTNPPVTLRVACLKLMRIIPDNAPGYSHTRVTVKRFLLDSAASAPGAVLIKTPLPGFSPRPHPVPEGNAIDLAPASRTPDRDLSHRYRSQTPTGNASTDWKPRSRYSLRARSLARLTIRERVSNPAVANHRKL